MKPVKPKRSWEELQELLKLWRRADRKNPGKGKSAPRGETKRRAVKDGFL